MSGTVRLHRVLNAPPERVFKAFLDPDALVKWMAPHGFTAKVHHLDPQVGGSYKMSFTNFLLDTVIPLAENTSKLCRINCCVIPTNLMIQIYPVKFK